GALRECKSAMERLAPIAGSGDTLLLASLGAAYGTYGKLKTNAQSAGEAVTYGRKAVRVYEELLAQEPANSQHRRTIALSQAYLAQALFLTGAKQEAVATFGKSVEALGGVLRTDPADRRLMLGFASVLVMQSGALLKAGEAAPGREAMKHGLSLFQALAESPGATDLELNEYANWLVRGEFSDLWRPETAMRMAQRAVRNSEERNPGYLDTLAWAHYRMGDLASAVAVQKKALRVMEGNAIFLSAPALRKEIEEALRLFEREAAEKK
ncbi:MAG: hypothetical protein JNK48_05790, partial [Bryobacterales bacterium]|nr:hypothetical protein [Bryobacterales bacterium]